MHSEAETLSLITSVTLGVNIAGYVNSEFGLGEGVRSTIRSLEAVSIPFVINNCTFNTIHRKFDSTYTNFSDDNPYPINIIQINADMISTFISSAKPEYFENKYNIGYWVCELPDFPKEWLKAFNLFDEIWTPSSYSVEAISEAYCQGQNAPLSPVPVLKVMHSIWLPQPTASKQSLGLPDNKFIFLFIFDFYSVFERKNPIAVIEAFQRAFDKDEQVLLVIKCSNAQKFPDKYKQLKDLARNFKNIKFIDKYLLKNDVNALIFHSDCYVSLHRSEGFGLTIAEAMFYGKPVIATAYSGNTDFMNVTNSFPVKYSLTTLTEDYGHYKKGSTWAEPDVDHAAYLMQYVFKNYEEAKQIGAKAAEHMRFYFSPKVIGQKMKNRLEYIIQRSNNLIETPQSHTDFKHKDAEIERLKALVDYMERSNFWQLRNRWFKLKGILQSKFN
ncbi:glycosyltransferase [Brasilonema octagenarum]|uniref:Glycosyltransferase family 1 protein n=1 Tax=Brasilonema octagenarum UFV-OR1 TaxID=417115 RepID=A0ABX1M1I7_9CYAN|nr:glycosyltransferase [Brasilonema octagenarum]NMF62360.1 glycosyltransferase family 1 protein [Brasilonema octagenarum UFV-OR1]